MHKYRHSHTQGSAECQWNQDGQYEQRKDDILGADLPYPAGVPQRISDLHDIIGHECDIGGLDGCIRTGNPHGHSAGRGGKGRRIIDAVAYHEYRTLPEL